MYSRFKLNRPTLAADLVKQPGAGFLMQKKNSDDEFNQVILFSYS